MTEVDLIEQTALRVGMKSLMNHGAGSCVYTEGCNGVSQEHLIAFAREVALHCVAALAAAGAKPEPEGEAVARVNNEGFIVEIGALPLAPGMKLYAAPSLTALREAYRPNVLDQEWTEHHSRNYPQKAAAIINAARDLLLALPAQVQPARHVGVSDFEIWFSTYNPASKGDKQRMRDAYAAGMSDEVQPAEQVGEPTDEQLNAHMPVPAVQQIIDIVQRIKAGAEHWEGGWSGVVPNCEDVLIRLHTISAIWKRRNEDHIAVVEQCSRLASSAQQQPVSAEAVAWEVTNAKLRYWTVTKDMQVAFGIKREHLAAGYPQTIVRPLFHAAISTQHQPLTAGERGEILIAGQQAEQGGK